MEAISITSGLRCSAGAESLLRSASDADADADAAQSTLARARARGARAGVPYAGEVTPAEAWELVTADAAILVDVRTAEERKFVGFVPATPHVAWATGMAMNRNPRFLREIEPKAPRDAVVLLLCRSAKRSALAAEAMTAAGWTQVFNVLEGFEGDLDDAGHRGANAGWRHRGLPWTQD